MGRHKTIGIKHMTPEQYNAYCREANRRSRQKKREQSGIAPKSTTHKTCTICKTTFPRISEFFYKTGISELGVQKLSSWCKSCHRGYLAQRRGKPAPAKGVSCDICWKPAKLFVVHDLSAARVIGEMCAQCRTMVNVAGYRPDLLRRAAEYLEDRA